VNTLSAFLEWCERHTEQVDYCSAYGERGYTDPENSILFADWNNIPKHWQNRLERMGCALEWFDEWYIDYDYGKAYRTSPDSYGWESSIMCTQDGNILTPDDDLSDWVNACALSAIDQPIHALPSWISADDIRKLGDGWQLLNAVYESGLRLGQTDRPADIARTLFQTGYSHVLFQISDVGQFDIKFIVWAIRD
jgi:hypothetical protein